MVLDKNGDYAKIRFILIIELFRFSLIVQIIGRALG